MDRMVAGLYYDEKTESAVFIRKNRPKFMAGMLNLPGGHVEDGETPRQAMAREFFEETGVPSVPSEWAVAAILKGPGGDSWEVSFLVAKGDSSKAKTMTDEPIEIHGAWNVPAQAMPNLRWLIPLCMDEHIERPVIVVDKTK